MSAHLVHKHDPDWAVDPTLCCGQLLDDLDPVEDVFTTDPAHVTCTSYYADGVGQTADPTKVVHLFANLNMPAVSPAVVQDMKADCCGITWRELSTRANTEDVEWTPYPWARTCPGRQRRMPRIPRRKEPFDDNKIAIRAEAGTTLPPSVFPRSFVDNQPRCGRVKQTTRVVHSCTREQGHAGMHRTGNPGNYYEWNDEYAQTVNTYPRQNGKMTAASGSQPKCRSKWVGTDKHWHHCALPAGHKGKHWTKHDIQNGVAH